MPKLIYPKDGLYNRCSNSVERVNKNLAGAINRCNFDIPSGFAYKNYLNGLDDKLMVYYQEASAIVTKIKRTDRNFRALSSQAETGAARLITSRVVKRARMIK